MKKIKMIMDMGERVLMGKKILFDDAMELSTVSEQEIGFLLSMADRIRQHYAGNHIGMCAISNVKSGQCSEDCKFCAQSGHYPTQVQIYPLMEKNAILQRARQAEKWGAERFAVVTSGSGMEDEEALYRIIDCIQDLRRQVSMKLCCSLGAVTLNQAKLLKEAGIERYHHNIETSSDYYPLICGTHTFTDRLMTIDNAQRAGLEVCSGGIIGMGEQMKDRIQMAFTLKELSVDAVPVNVLHPIPGTPLAGQVQLSPLEIMKTFAIFRFILPEREIRTAGGREQNLREFQGWALRSGISGMMIGGYLTTGGRKPEDDRRMVGDAGFDKGELRI